MAIGTPINLGYNTGNPVSSIAVTSGASVSGALIVAFVKTSGGQSSFACNDDHGNSYSAAVNSPGANGVVVYYAANATLNSGQKITVSCSGSGDIGVAAIAVAGIATSSPLDVASSVASGSGNTSTAINSGALASGNEILIGNISSNSGVASITPQNGFTAIGGGSSGSDTVRPAYLLVSSTASVAWQATLSGSVSWKSVLVSFKGVGGSTISDTVAETGSAAEAESATAGFVTSQVESGSTADASTSALSTNGATTETGAAADAAAADIIAGVKGAGRPKKRRRWEILLPDGSILASAGEAEHRARLQQVREEALRASAAEAARQEAVKLRRLAAAVERRQAQRPDDDAAIALLLTAL